MASRPPRGSRNAKRKRAGAQQFLPFGQALAVAHSLGLNSSTEWKAWSKSGARPANMPSRPDRTYRHVGWQGWEHWVDPGNQESNTAQVLPYGEARAVARSLGLQSQSEWHAWCKSGARPANMPAAPPKVYKHAGWQGWGQWLDMGAAAGGQPKKFMAFEDALAVARSLGLNNQREWQAWRKRGARPANMPSCPDQTYKHDGWQGFGHWLGTGNQRRNTAQMLPFEEALAAARSLGLASEKEWKAWSKDGARPASMPSRPDQVYKHKGWQGWGNWLGTGTIASHRKSFLSFKDSLVVARSLGLNSSTEWKARTKSGAGPANIPARPDETYKHEGWQGWGHWLGTGNQRNGNGHKPASVAACVPGQRHKRLRLR